MKPDQKKIFDQLREALSQVDPLLADLVSADDLSRWFTDELEIASFRELYDFAQHQADLGKASAPEQPAELRTPAKANLAQELFRHHLKAESRLHQAEGNTYRAMSDAHYGEQDRLLGMAGMAVEQGSHAALARLCKHIADEASTFSNCCAVASGR